MLEPDMPESVRFQTFLCAAKNVHCGLQRNAAKHERCYKNQWT
jgi:hypothetical protein